MAISMAKAEKEEQDALGELEQHWGKYMDFSWASQRSP